MHIYIKKIQNCIKLSLPAIVACILLWGQNAHSETGVSIPVTPWENEQANPNEHQYLKDQPIKLQKLSIDDIEQLQTTPNKKEKKSALEDIYSNRIVDELYQYGYDLFDTAKNMEQERNTIPAGVVQDDYILSSGDTLNIIVRGQVNINNNYTINNQGMLIIDEFTPTTASGKSIGELRHTLQNEANGMHNTNVFISLNGVRQINVLVTGDVKKPGRKNLTAFHTTLDALSIAGGVNKTGSLRQIKLIRKGKTYIIDLYQLLMASTSGADKLLQDGDRIIVPPIGPTMAISGSVKRPAIYEIRRHEKISLHQALQLAGGVLMPGQSRYVKMEFTKDGNETIQDVSTAKQRIFGDGSILMVAQSKQKQASAVILEGETRQPGTHDLKKARTLSILITNDKVLGKDIYPLIGIIERRDPNQLTKELIEFSPRNVLTKKEDKKLNDGDIVHLFSIDDIKSLSEEQNDKNKLYHKASFTDPKNKTAIDNPIVKSFLKERSAFIRGAVRQEGAYPIAKETTLDSALAIAGGTSLEADKTNIEVSSLGNGRKFYNLETTSPNHISIKAGDTIRVNQKFHKIHDKSVMILGEVNHPGRYDIMPGDTMLKLMERAGGVTEQAYPDGAIFSRAVERKREKNRYKAQAQDLEMKLASALSQTDKDKKPDMGQVNATQSLIAQLKNATAVGRITVEADPDSLKSDPSQDILLEAGDKIFIPKRPLTVRVAGEVLSPASLQFRSGKDPLEYIKEAGGTTYYADKGRAFVIYPDGSAQPLAISTWSYSSAMIPPGSTIIVPRDPKPFDFLESAERVTQILANLAISGLYIDALGDNNN